jgi:ATP-dependent protease ClpP protease subunit
MDSVWHLSSKKKVSKPSKKRKLSEDDDDDAGGESVDIGDLFKGSNTTYTMNNHIYFNDDVTQSTMFELAKELRQTARTLRLRAFNYGIEVQPIYLHITTDGGEISAALSVVDCIKGLMADGVKVYSVIDGFVASAGTLLTLAAEKRYIQPNAYMLIHQLSSGVWGKMSAIEEQVGNMKKLMQHLRDFYLQHTKLTPKALERLLLTDVTWNATESLRKGLVDEIYTGV